MQSYSFFGLAMPVGDFIQGSQRPAMIDQFSVNFLSYGVSFTCKV
jgi:hypothetical protein